MPKSKCVRISSSYPSPHLPTSPILQTKSIPYLTLPCPPPSQKKIQFKPLPYITFLTLPTTRPKNTPNQAITSPYLTLPYSTAHRASKLDCIKFKKKTNYLVCLAKSSKSSVKCCLVGVSSLHANSCRCSRSTRRLTPCLLQSIIFNRDLNDSTPCVCMSGCSGRTKFVLCTPM